MSGKISHLWARVALLSAAFAVPAARAVAAVTVTDEAAGWVLRVDGQPFTVRGIAYTPERINEDPNIGTLNNWMVVDRNGNGLIDTAYESFVDGNRNNVKDASEPAVGDWALLRDMGVNTIRIYHHPSNDASVQAGYGGGASSLRQFNHAPNKTILRDLHENYGIRVAMGDLFGAYTVGAGATNLTDYTAGSPHRDLILASVRQMVVDFKDEPWLLLYVLGNENNYDSITFGNANANAADFADLVGDAVEMIKALDADHPIAISLGDDGDNLLPAIAALPANRQPDIIGTNVYRGPAFEGIYDDIFAIIDKPVLLLEYGDSSTQFNGTDIDETNQSAVYEEALDDIDLHVAGAAGRDTAIGGIAFAWLDSWWQSGAAGEHTIRDTTLTPGNNFQNEWHGFMSQGSGAFSPLLRQIRSVYFMYQARWNPGPRSIGPGGGSTVFHNAGAFTTVSFPAGTFPTGGNVSLAPAFVFPLADSPVLDLTGTGEGFELTEASALQPARPVTIYYPYAHGGAGYVLARYDADNDAWIPLRTRRDGTGALIAETSHFSLFQVMQSLPSPSVAFALAFPNPARPAQGHTAISFTRVPPAGQIKLYTSSGELVRELYADTAGIALWDLRNADGREVASGVYFALIDGEGGEQTVKVAVQR